jgi:UDP-glucose 4-epimerase
VVAQPAVRDAAGVSAARRLLVTGANGFIGASIAAAAGAAGWQVRAASRRLPATGGAGIEVVRGIDCSGDADWRAALGGIDVVMHCAARVHVLRETADDALAAFRAVNVDGTLALARQAAAAGVQRFVYISTIGVNGAETFGRPFRADDVPAPHSPYARSKHEAEAGLRALERQTGLDVVVVRPPLVHGPGARGNFARLLQVLDRGLPLPLASVDNRRSLVGLGNLVDLLLVCAAHPAARGQTLLVSDAEDVSTPALLRRLAAALDRRARLFPAPVGLLRGAARLFGRAALVQQLCGSLQVDIEATRARLDWSPPVSLDAELARAARHFRAFLAGRTAT